MINKKDIKNISFFLLNQIKQKKYMNNILNNNHLTILNLHRVSTEINLFYPPLQPKLFEELLKFILKNFNIITFNEIQEYKNHSKPSLILSFDDGFKDFIDYAVPIMDKYNVKSNQNVIPTCIENNSAVWDVKIFDFLNSSPYSLINEIKLPNFTMKINKNNKVFYGLELMKYLKSYNKEEREKLFLNLNEVINKNSTIQYTEMMNKKEIIEIAKVHEVGVHSFSHESMGLESKQYFEDDFLKCKDYFKNQLGLPLNIYAFPSGSHKASQLEFLKKNSIEHILLVNENYSSYQKNIHDRFTFYGDSISEIKVRALGWHR